MYWRLSQGCLRHIGCRGMSRRFAIRSRAIGSRDKYRCTLVQRYPGVTFFRMRMPSMAREAREACEVCRDNSDDLQPDRKELAGTQAPREMLQKRPTDVTEMSANEEILQDWLKEMPSNEIPRSEVVITQNGIVPLTDSTTLTSQRSTSDRANYS